MKVQKEKNFQKMLELNINWGNPHEGEVAAKAGQG